MPFSDEELVEAIANYLPKIEEYVKSHEGTMGFAGVKDGVAYIQLGGTCGGCSMSNATTKMVVQKQLRELIHPEIVVENVFAGMESELPEGIVRPAV